MSALSVLPDRQVDFVGLEVFVEQVGTNVRVPQHTLRVAHAEQHRVRSATTRETPLNIYIYRERQTDRQRQRQTDRDRETERQRQTDRNRDRQTDTDRGTETEAEVREYERD